MYKKINVILKTSILKRMCCYLIALLLGAILGVAFLLPFTLKIRPIRDYRFNDDSILVESIEDVQTWCYHNIEYRYDIDVWGKREYWQLPEETYVMGTGDCEDYAIMFMYLCKTKLGITPKMVTARNKKSKVYHAMVKIDDTFYEVTQTHPDMPEWNKGGSISDEYDNIMEIPYGKVMRFAQRNREYILY